LGSTFIVSTAISPAKQLETVTLEVRVIVICSEHLKRDFNEPSDQKLNSIIGLLLLHPK
jgi:hypothetical protein